MKRFTAPLAASLVLVAMGTALALQPGQAQPKRLYSNGDSITRAFDADLPADNLNLSWVNGYFGFWEQLFGLPNVKSHNQRISANWGSSGRANYIAAVNGARVDDLATQANGAGGKSINYATVMLGGNDVCRDTIADLPSDAQFQADFTAGLTTLLSKMANGTTVQVAAIPDIKRLYDIGKDKDALGIADCEVLWALTVLGFPCGSMLSPFNSEADRLYVRSRNIGYNTIMANVTAQKQAQNPGKFISFTNVTFTYAFAQNEISNIDCFHPSWRGEKALSKGTWDSGPFAAHQGGS
jgi:lysophospholipase L1-like esterase